MKKILFSAISAFAVGAVVAADSTQFGVLKVPSTARETIVSVPWLESTTGDSAVCVSNLVLTSGLSEGDELLAYKGTSYDGWVLTKGSDNVLYWNPSTNVKVGETSVSAGADKAQLTRGQAIILRRKGTITDGFCIMGKPATTVAEDLALSSGTSASPSFSLIAPPNIKVVDDALAPVDANNDLTWYNLKPGKDELIVAKSDGDGFTSYIWTGKRWMDANGGTTAVIPAGMGAWFKSIDETSSKSVKWSKSKE